MVCIVDMVKNSINVYREIYLRITLNRIKMELDIFVTKKYIARSKHSETKFISEMGICMKI